MMHKMECLQVRPQVMMVLPKNFDLTVFNKLGPWVLKCLNFVFEKGVLTASQRQAVITLVEKNKKKCALH